MREDSRRFEDLGEYDLIKALLVVKDDLDFEVVFMFEDSETGKYDAQHMTLEEAKEVRDKLNVVIEIIETRKGFENGKNE